MKQSSVTKEKKGNHRTKPASRDALIEYGLGSAEAKALLSELCDKYGRTVVPAAEVRASLDSAMGSQTLTELLYKLREEE